MAGESTAPAGRSDAAPARRAAEAALPAAWAVGTGIVLVSLVLRPGATSTGPVLEEIRAGIGMGTTSAALLSALPGLSFAASGAVAARLGHRLGAVGGLALAALLAAIGLLARAASGTTAVFLLMSLVALFGAGLGNVLLPMAIKQRFPLHSGGWTAVYVTVLPIGSLLPQLVAPAIVESSAGWRGSLGVWGWVSALAVVPWLSILLARLLSGRRVVHEASRKERSAPGRADGELGASSLLEDEVPEAAASASGIAAVRPVGLADVARSPRARAMALFFGMQSMQAYVAFGWLPQIFRDAGAPLDRASLLLAAFSVWGLPGGFIIPPLVTRSRHLQAWVMFFVAMLVVGYAGLLAAPPTGAWLWPCALGISGFCFQVALVLVTHRTRDYRVTAALSGFTQSVGYALASAGPFVVGWVHGLTGGWTVPLCLLIVSTVPMARAGWRACADGVIDDELDGAAGAPERP
ncbi:MFS transporter [Actinomyces radicidentis]|uniref:MFS transporter n=1 Tax=Actinomyces radicidentis TaxID=111015 RepID=UPI0028EA8B10|nr:MFS transporter [Actinomyces radicidentis]